MSLTFAWSLLSLAFPAASGAPPSRPGESPREGVPLHRAPAGLPDEPVELDLLRPFEGAPRLYVQAELPDGSLGLFLVDTGADISVITSETADRVGVRYTEERWVYGLSGAARVRMGELPTVGFGDAVVRDVEVAVGAPGLQDRAGFMPVDGLLGNNVWSHFTLEVDYPADVLVLHPGGTGLPKRRATPMFFDGGHVNAMLEVTTDEALPRTELLVAQVDTGASDLTICAGTGVPLSGGHTEGLESVRGLGASDTLPPYRFLQMTRRIPLRTVTLGGAQVEADLPARWVAYEDIGGATCDQGPGAWRALIGHEYLAGHRVLFDYRQNTWALLRSHRPARRVNGHQVLLDQEVAAHGDDPTRGLERARLLLGTGKDQEAVGELERFVGRGDAEPGDQAEAAVLLAQLLRHLGRHVEAWEVLDGLSAGDLVDQDQIVGTVNGLLFEDRGPDARALAEAGVEQRPDDGWAHVALADVEITEGNLDRARDTLLEAARIEGYPDAHLLRRARVALAAGDRVGAMAMVRRLLELYPADGPYVWLYSMLVETDEDRQRFQVDLETAMARLHPFSRPTDFLVAAHHVLGHDDQVRRLLSEGLTEACDPLPDGPEDDNCRAWFFALAGEHEDEALTRIERALAATGDRPDFLDTKAMVHLSRGEWQDALASARAAARLSPDDVYMLWQAQRIEELAVRGAPTGTQGPDSTFGPGSPPGTAERGP